MAKAKAKSEPAAKPAKDSNVVEFDYSGEHYYAWRDDGQRPDFPIEEAEKNIHMVLAGTLPPDHYGTTKP